ncbi:MAG: hypothetical protein ABSF63_13975 [Candidatus Bathyarchaeia archaeon]|jgi:hypothetical protein
MTSAIRGRDCQDPKRAYLISIVPVYDTQIDVAPKLDANFARALTPGGEPEMAQVGSRAVRRMIEKYAYSRGFSPQIHICLPG